MYVVVVVIVAMLLAFPQPPAELRFVSDPAQVLAIVAAAVVLPASWGVLVARRTQAALEADPAQPTHAQAVYGRGMLLAQAVLLLSHGGLLAFTDWILLCRRVPIVGGWLLVPTLLALMPLLLSIVLTWVAVYPADRAIRRVGIELLLLRGRPVRAAWSLRQFVLYSLRHQVLFVLAPMMLILAARDVVARYTPGIQRFAMRLSGHDVDSVRRSVPLTPAARYLPDLLLGGCTVIVALVAPAILRRVWDTRPLASGALRDRLTLLCKRLRMGCREILVWRSGGMLVNAAVMGVVAPLRYVLITDAMLEQMDDTRVEAVFGHEAGHVKRHHITFFLLFMLITGCLATVATALSDRLSQPLETICFASFGAIICLKWGVLFGWISRRFERQADVFGVRTLTLAGLPCHMPCWLHHPPGDAAAGPSDASPLSQRQARLDDERVPLCRTASSFYGDTLNEVAVLNGIRPEARSWRHSSIASRSRFVQKLAVDAHAARKFDQAVWRIKISILLAAAGSAAWASWELRLWELLGK